METKTITYEGPGEPLSVTVGEADVLMGMRHTMLISEAQTLRWPDQDEDQDDEKPQQKKTARKQLTMPEGNELAVYLIRRWTWPNCKAATLSSSGFDISSLAFEEFCRLPEHFVSRWERAVLDLNPHWQLQARETEEEDAEEKKEESASAKE